MQSTPFYVQNVSQSDGWFWMHPEGEEIGKRFDLEWNHYHRGDRRRNWPTTIYVNG